MHQQEKLLTHSQPRQIQHNHLWKMAATASLDWYKVAELDQAPHPVLALEVTTRELPLEID
jgi:hypothetical protein